MAILKLSEKKQQIVEKAINRLVEKTNMNVYRTIKKKLVMTFGEDNVQIAKMDEENICRRLREYGYNDTNIVGADDNGFTQRVDQIVHTYHAIVRIPEFTIKNSRGGSVTIRDMFVRIQLAPDGKLAHGGLEGVVTTFTKAQARYGYMHSHLLAVAISRGNHPTFNTFCLGTGQINQIIALLRREFNEINFQMFCLHIKNFLEWESLEGNPYCRFGDVQETVTTIPISTVASPYFILVSEMLRKEFYKLPTDKSKELISIHPDTYEIHVEPTEDLEKWAADAILSKQGVLIGMNINPSDLLAVKDSTGIYYKFSPDTGNLSVSNKTVLHFRGEDIKIKIIDNEKNLKGTKYANPKIIEQLCKKISADLTTTALDYAYTGSNDTSGDKPEATVTNHDPVREAT